MDHKIMKQGFFDKIMKKQPAFDFDLIVPFARSIVALHEAVGLLEGYFNKVGLSKGRFQVLIQLYHLDKEEGMSLSDVCTFHKVSSATMTGLVDNLEKEGLIERFNAPEDRRKVYVRLTEKGNGFMEGFLPVHMKNIIALTSEISQDEKYDLMKLLIKFTDSLKNNMGKVQEVKK